MRGYQEFEKFARETVANYVNYIQDLTDDRLNLTADEVYITWYAKELQNQKAMLSTPRPDGMYYEFTWNGDKEEAYLDVYKKLENRVVSLPK